MNDPIDDLLRAARRLRNEGRTTEACEADAESAARARAAGRALQQAHALRHLSDVGRELGRLREALAAGREAVDILRASPHPAALDLANALRVSALALQGLGRADEARPSWREARSLYAAAGVEAGVAQCEANL